MSEEYMKYRFSSIQQQKLFDIRGKLAIARSIVLSCLANEAVVFNELCSPFFEEASQYIPDEIIKKLVVKIFLHNTPQTFLNSHLQNSLENNEGNADYKIDKLIRDIMVHHYILEKCPPTKKSFITKFNMTKNWSKEEIDSSLKIRGFKLKRLPHSAKSIIVEDPRCSFQRIKYLHSMAQFRNSGAHIVYIEEKIINKYGFFLDTLDGKNEEIKLIFLAVSSTVGIIEKKVTFFPSPDIPLLTNWILDNVVPQLSVPSVIVLEDKHDNQKSYNDMPTIYSSKKDMLNWLELNDIPHCSKMHSAELFELIKKSRRSFPKKKYVIDEYLRSYGHKVLRRPPKTQYLNYYNVIWNRAENRIDEALLHGLGTTNLDYWTSIEIMLHKTEKTTLDEDIAVDFTVEKIFTMAKHGHIPYEDIKYCDDEVDETKVTEVVPFLS